MKETFIYCKWPGKFCQISSSCLFSLGIHLEGVYPGNGNHMWLKRPSWTDADLHTAIVRGLEDTGSWLNLWDKSRIYRKMWSMKNVQPLYVQRKVIWYVCVCVWLSLCEVVINMLKIKTVLEKSPKSWQRLLPLK